MLNALKLIAPPAAKSGAAEQLPIGGGSAEKTEESAWWYDFEQIHTRQRPSEKDHPDEAAVDLLLQCKQA